MKNQNDNDKTEKVQVWIKAIEFFCAKDFTKSFI